MSGVAAFLGSLLGQAIGTAAGMLTIPIWDGTMGIFLGVALALSQSWYLRRLQVAFPEVRRTALRGVVAGVVAGFVFVFTRAFFGRESDVAGLVAAWSIEGLVFGFALAPVIPNLPRPAALVGGMVAGFIGVIAMIALNALAVSITGATAPVFMAAIGDSFKGIFLGAMLPVVERLAGKLALLVHWGPGQEATVLLGATPVKIGRSQDCQIYLPDAPGSEDVAATVNLVDGVIGYEDHFTRSTQTLDVGSSVTVGGVRVEVVTR